MYPNSRSCDVGTFQYTVFSHFVIWNSLSPLTVNIMAPKEPKISKKQLLYNKAQNIHNSRDTRNN